MCRGMPAAFAIRATIRCASRRSVDRPTGARAQDQRPGGALAAASFQDTQDQQVGEGAAMEGDGLGDLEEPEANQRFSW